LGAETFLATDRFVRPLPLLLPEAAAAEAVPLPANSSDKKFF
jgi:hypothetical protein